MRSGSYDHSGPVAAAVMKASRAASQQSIPWAWSVAVQSYPQNRQAPWVCSVVMALVSFGRLMGVTLVDRSTVVKGSSFLAGHRRNSRSPRWGAAS
jgi:hypothetical protein